MVVYGPSGVGKTSFAANFEKTIFVIDRQERGIHDLLRFRQCPEPVEIIEVDGWEHLLAVNEKLARRRDFFHACYDSLTGLEQLCFKYHCKKYFDDDWSSKGFFSYMQGPKNAAKRDWPELIQSWETIKDSGKSIIAIGHSQAKPFNNPDGPDYERFSPYLDKETWAATHRWAELILFYRFKSEVRKEGARHKADADRDVRLICCEHSSLYDAKNRCGMSPVIVAGVSGREAYEKFSAAYEKASR